MRLVDEDHCTACGDTTRCMLLDYDAMGNACGWRLCAACLRRGIEMLEPRTERHHGSTRWDAPKRPES